MRTERKPGWRQPQASRTAKSFPLFYSQDTGSSTGQAEPSGDAVHGFSYQDLPIPDPGDPYSESNPQPLNRSL